MPKSALSIILLALNITIGISATALYITSAIARSAAVTDALKVGWFVINYYLTNDDSGHVHFILSLYGFTISNGNFDGSDSYRAYSTYNEEFAHQCDVYGKKTFILVITALSISFVFTIITIVRLANDSTVAYVISALLAFVSAALGASAVALFSGNCVSGANVFISDVIGASNYTSTLYLKSGGICAVVGFGIMAVAFLLNFFVPIEGDQGFTSVNA